MTRIHHSPPAKNWTAIENSFIDGPTPDDYPREAWTLVRLIRHHKAVFSNRQHLCNSINKPLKTFERHLRTLRELGLIEPTDDGYRIQIGEQVLDLAAEELDVVPEKLIIAEIEEQPKRKPTGLSQKDRWELIKEAWNKHKPDNYLQLDGSVNTPVLIAIETQTKRLGVDRDDYDGFIGAVLRGAGADDWWSTKDMTAAKVFGFGANLDDKKFFNVEKLYKSGLTIERKEQRGAANVEAIRRRQEEEFRQMDEIEAAQAENAKRLSLEYAEIEAAWDATRKDGWAPCNGDHQVHMAVKRARELLGVTESYEDFLRKCFAGYISEQLTPREFANMKTVFSPRWREAPLVDSYTWYQKENA